MLQFYTLLVNFFVSSIRISVKKSASPLEPLTPFVPLPAARMTRSKFPLLSISLLCFWPLLYSIALSVTLHWTTTTRQVTQQQSPRQKLPLSIGILFAVDRSCYYFQKVNNFFNPRPLNASTDFYQPRFLFFFSVRIDTSTFPFSFLFSSVKPIL